MASLTQSLTQPLFRPLTLMPGDDAGNPSPPVGPAGAFLLENNDRLQLEDATGVLLLEG